MIVELDAIFEDGVLRPLEPLALAEHQKVRVTVDVDVASRPPESPARNPDEHSARLKRATQWHRHNARNYRGQWVALDGDRLIAHGHDRKAVTAAARASGVENPLIDRILEVNAELSFFF